MTELLILCAFLLGMAVMGVYRSAYLDDLMNRPDPGFPHTGDSDLVRLGGGSVTILMEADFTEFDRELLDTIQKINAVSPPYQWSMNDSTARRSPAPSPWLDADEIYVKLIDAAEFRRHYLNETTER